MSCSCLIDSCSDGETMRVGTISNRKARKEHTCIECKRIINPKETYKNIKGIWEEVWEEFKICNDCISVQKSLGKCSCLCNLWEDIEFGLKEIIQFERPGKSDIPWSDISKCTKTAQEKIFNIIEKLWKKRDEEETNV